MVLVDTAGRMQDNEPLMRALSSLIHANAPNLVLFVGEALVGNDAVDQLVKFNRRVVGVWGCLWGGWICLAGGARPDAVRGGGAVDQLVKPDGRAR